MEQVNFYETHIFKYSRRKGTRADRMEGQVAEEEKNRRSRVLIGMGKAHERNYMESFLGKEVEILFEETAEIQGETYWTGHTREYLKTAVKASENLENRIMTATVTGFLQDGIFICRI